jgi:hypothetical protein
MLVSEAVVLSCAEVTDVSASYIYTESKRQTIYVDITARSRPEQEALCRRLFGTPQLEVRCHVFEATASDGSNEMHQRCVREGDVARLSLRHTLSHASIIEFKRDLFAKPLKAVLVGVEDTDHGQRATEVRYELGV